MFKTNPIDGQTAMTQNSCPLCRNDGEDILFKNDLYRIIAVNDPAWPGFCRVILNRHAAEMTDLPIEERSPLMKAVCVVESALRTLMQPIKINLASLGNVVAHVHWHIIPRWADDTHFPDPIWAPAKRPASLVRSAPDRAALIQLLNDSLA
jgi:diadenosine tetraphosphate (Ap4A) HIT family hydrolase